MQRAPVRDAQLARPREHELRVRPCGDPPRDRLQQGREERRREIAKRVGDGVRFCALENLRDECIVLCSAA